REAHIVVADAGERLLLGRELAVSGAGRVDRQALGVADVGQVREQLQAINKRGTGRFSTLDAEAQDAALAPRQILLGPLIRRVLGQAGVVDPRDFGVLLEIPGDRQRVLAVALHAQPERLDALQEQEGVERAERRAYVAQELHARLDDIGQRPERL